jgi:hypothetical protein
VNKNQAAFVFKLTSTAEWQQGIDRFIDERIEELRNQFDTVHNLESLRFIQGQIDELKRFKTIRDTANIVLDKK